jgi:hypothetical protein
MFNVEEQMTPVSVWISASAMHSLLIRYSVTCQTFLVGGKKIIHCGDMAVH